MRTDLLVDPRVGIVRRLVRRPTPAHFPASYTIVDSYLADTTVFCRHAADSAGAGYAFADEARATAAAVGEAAERYCGNLVPPGLRTGSSRDIEDAINPAAFAVFSAGQYREPGFPCVPFTDDLALAWAAGTDLGSGRPVAVPASLVWPSHAAAAPRTNPIIQAGLAAGPSLAAAQWSALCEVIERDAMVLAWMGRGGLHRLDPPAHLCRLGRGPTGALHTRWYAFPTEVRMPVVGALVRDASTGHLALGMGCHPDLVTAHDKALGEALQLLILLGDYDDPDGAFAHAARRPDSPLKPWRPARDYAAAYRPDLRDAVDYGCHLQLHLDPAIQELFETELDDAVIDTGPVWDPPADLAAAVRRLDAVGHRVVSVDVTTDDVRTAGLHVARILVPGFYSNSAVGLPFLGGARLGRSLAGRPPRLVPMPH